MKLSNFEWTDKESVKWFVLLPSGHEGPYSLNSLKGRFEAKTLGGDSKIWAEGLPDGITLKQALYQYEAALSSLSQPPLREKVTEVVETPPVFSPPPVEVARPVTIEDVLPPLPKQEDEIPPLPPIPEEAERVAAPSGRINLRLPLMAAGVVFFLLYLAQSQWIKGNEVIEFQRRPKMSLDLYERIQQEMLFDGWDKKVFFKEYVPADFSSIWFVTSGFQTCDVEANFRSIKEKTLSLSGEETEFRSQAKLTRHLVEFTRFEFQKGQKVLPGLYEVDISAKNCEWDTLVARAANRFNPPDQEYVARVKMILFPNGASEFNSVLDKLLKKKNDMAVRVQGKDEQFWQTIVEKLQTLEAITYQVEQFFLDVLAQDARKFDQNVKSGVARYTKQFGSVLTNFVISNEKDFDQISQSDIERVADGADYEKVVRLTSKSIGFESMKLIEHFQTLKKPKRAQLNEEKKKVSKIYGKLREKISSELAQIQKNQAPKR